MVTGLAASTESTTYRDDIGGGAKCNGKFYYNCGNIEIDKCTWYGETVCVCGDNTFSFEDWRNNDKRCCQAPGEYCRTNNEGDGVCNNGIMINEDQSCDYAHFSCDNNRTVDKYEMCHGYTLCQDGTDLEMCSALACDTSTQASCEDGTNTNTDHRECYLESKGNDGSYDCLNGRDEKTFTRDTSVRIDFSELKNCNDSYGQDGMTCGSECVSSFDWCRKEKSKLCVIKNSSFNTASKEICNNATIWREKNITCDYTFHDLWHGMRCNGTNQQCIMPLYTSRLLSPFPKHCEDRSDQVFRTGLTCWDIALEHMKTFCHTFCTPERTKQLKGVFGNYEKQKCSEKCFNPSAWLSSQTNPFYLDPHLCQDSCKNSSLHCEACSNEKYPRCLVNNKTVCYHPDL